MLNVLLVEHDLNETFLADTLEKAGMVVVKIPYGKAFLGLASESKPDLIVANFDTLPKAMIVDLHSINQHLAIPVIIFANDSRNEVIDEVINAEVSAYVVEGLSEHRVQTIIQIALARFRHKQQLKESLKEAQAQLADRKQIDRAKAILMKTRNFSEDEAYHTLRKLAMGRNITLGEMARNVIAMAELLK
jgi:response regulator NasT